MSKRTRKVPKPLSEWPELMVPEQLAECLAVDVKLVYAMIRQGAPCSRIGKRHYRLFRDPFVAWLLEQKKVPAADVSLRLAPFNSVRLRLADFDGDSLR